MTPGLVLRAALLLVLLAPPAYAGDLSIQSGVGIGNSDGKMLSASYTTGLPYLPDAVKLKPTVGLYNDNNFFNSDPTGFAALPVGVLVDAGPLYVGVFVGPAGITQTDDTLGTYFQMWLDVVVGIANENAYVGGSFRHLSNGGISRVNEGREFVGIEVGLKW